MGLVQHKKNISLFTILFGISAITLLLVIPSSVYAQTNNDLMAKLNTIDGKVQTLMDIQDSFYSITIPALNFADGAIGLRADCDDITQAHRDAGLACVFTVDSVRYEQTQFAMKDVKTGIKGGTTEMKPVPGKVLGVCVDFVNTGAATTPVSNCSPSIIETGDIGSSVGLGFGPEIGVGTGATIGLGIGPDFSWGTSMPVIEPVQVPLPNQFNIGDKQIGGNILTDSQLGSIVATKFVILKNQDFKGNVHITGVKNSLTSLEIAKATSSGATCIRADTSGCDSEFISALTATAGLGGVTNVMFEQEHPFGVTNVEQKNHEQLGQIRTVGTTQLPSVGIENLLDGHEADVQALTNLRNDQLADIIDLDDVDMLLDKLKAKDLDTKLETLAIAEAQKLPPLAEKVFNDVVGLVDINGVVMDIKDTVDDVEQTITDVENGVNGITMTIETEVNKIITEIEDFFNP